jgi:spore maturation protein SpmB
MVSLSTTSHPLAACVREGSKDGLAAAWALIKIVLPVSVVVTILDYLGMVQLISKVCRPVLTLCGLPGEAVFPLISGAFLGVYSAIAALTSIQGVFTLKDLNIMAVMIMIAHNLVVETAIQRRCGIRGSVIVLVRILAALATGAVLALIIPNSTQLLTFTGSNQFATTGLANVLVDWLWGMARLLLKISSIVIALMIIYRFIEDYGVLNRLY